MPAACSLTGARRTACISSSVTSAAIGDFEILINSQGTIVATGSIAYPVGLGNIGKKVARYMRRHYFQRVD